MSAEIPYKIITEACQTTQARVILIGGQALSALGYQRMTLDVDFMITEPDYIKLKPVVETHGYKEVVRTDVAAKMRVESGKLIDIDFLFVEASTFEGVLKEARQENFGDYCLSVPKPEHLIALKLHAISQQPEKRERKDLNDIIELIKANQIDVNNPAFKTLCLKFSNLALYEKIQREINN